MGIDISSAYIYSAFQLHKHTISTTRETQLLTHLSLVYDSVYHSLKHNQQTSTLSRTSLNTSFSSPTETKCFSNSQATNHAPCPEHLKDHPATELEARPKMPAAITKRLLKPQDRQLVRARQDEEDPVPAPRPNSPASTPRARRGDREEKGHHAFFMALGRKNIRSIGLSKGKYQEMGE